MADPRFHKKLRDSLTLSEICEEAGIAAPDSYDLNFIIENVASIQDASSQHITCFHNTLYREDLKKTKAGACFVKKEHISYLPSHTIAIVTPLPYRCFGKIASLFYPFTPVTTDLHVDETAKVHPQTKIGENCSIGPFAVVGKDVVLGDEVHIGAYTIIHEGCTVGDQSYISDHVTISHADLGQHVYVKPGARIGQTGFGFDMHPQGHLDIPQLGSVIIEDNVQIGANVCIDRGSQSDTIIAQGARIDNLVQIAHNVEVGENSVLVAQVGIAGSTRLGRFVIVAGQVGIAGHLEIGDNARIAAQSGVMRHVQANTSVAGSPSLPVRDWHKQTIVLKNLIKDPMHDNKHHD